MTRSSTRCKTILVAEDHEEVMELMRTFLEGEGYFVLSAENGELAVEVALREFPDLIMMDLNMPLLDGFEAAKRIRQHPSMRNVPILANSAYGDCGIRFNLRDEELGPGFTFYFTKPLAFDDLQEMLQRLLPED